MKSICRIPVTLGLIVLLTSVAPRLALAAEPTEDDANAAATAGRYQEALEAYSKLYLKTREPTYLHNVARCYQKLGRPDEAIDYFNRYLRLAKDLEESVKIEVHGYILEMEALKESQRKEKAAAAAASRPMPVQTPSPVATPAPTATVPPILPGHASAPQASPGLVNSGVPPAGYREGGEGAKSTSSLRIAAAVTGGVGLVATGVAVYYGMRARDLQNQVTTAHIFDRSADSDGETAHTMQFVMYGVAGAFLAGSAVFYYLSLKPDTGSGRVSLLPSVGPAFAGGTLIARF